MTSRTAEGKHTKRFIIEVLFDGSKEWSRSSNTGLTGFFPTREEAQAALDPNKAYISEGMKYRVRQK